MHRKIILFFSISAFFLLLGVIFVNGSAVAIPSKGGLKSLASASLAVSQIELEKNYQKYASAVISAFGQTKAENRDMLEAVRKSKAELLALRVPAKYTDLHLDLIISLGLMEEGLTKNQPSLVLGEERFKDLTGKYPWLLTARY